MHFYWGNPSNKSPIHFSIVYCRIGGGFDRVEEYAQVKLDNFPKYRVENLKTKWNHYQVVDGSFFPLPVTYYEEYASYSPHANGVFITHPRCLPIDLMNSRPSTPGRSFMGIEGAQPTPPKCHAKPQETAGLIKGISWGLLTTMIPCWGLRHWVCLWPP